MGPKKPGVTAARCRAERPVRRIRVCLFTDQGTVVNTASQDFPGRSIDEIDRARAREYALLAILLSHSPDAQLLSGLAGLPSDSSPIGLAHAALAKAARQATEESVDARVFCVVRRTEGRCAIALCLALLDRYVVWPPLARIREALQRLGVEKAPESIEPEDHAGFLCEVMAGLVGGDISAPDGTDRAFFEEHLASWLRRFFADLETTKFAGFYRSVGTLGRTFIDVEAHAFALSA